ncbi:MFS transporter, DHA3 family, macrolide efflux protein [Desulfotomaculum arcticum]|uniref:MFS transporter, DHA3 family, macrolide efflux protein n=1 Tax=Desulfotruncus arcticus DSM 17038 TaxID=1121424 RepID=A0A1I2YQH3_9FIRM|nr:MFS transporter [Desulfotruncus arcticus]SFH27847.1 MFS transporter, DHA3 family, macrolide efflux protein [Desulfotomaculum arcticum] [Desulfotruncus arcticus DSM 17038]
MRLTDKYVIEADKKTNWQKSIILFLGSQSISLFGSSLVQYAIMWYITLTTQSGVMMTISIICGFVPTFILSPVAGVWADRYNRKALIILSDSLIAISTLILAILFLIGYDALWLLFVMSAVRAIGTGIQTPAVGAILPQLVPEDKLTKVNGTNGSIQALVMLVSPMVSGALLTMASIETIFFIDVITAAIAIIILFVFLDIPVHAKALQKQTTSYFSDLQQGLTYIKNHDFVKQFFVFFAFFFVLVAPAAFLTPLQITRSFGDDVWRLTANEIAYSLGMILGGIIMASWGGFKNKIHTMTISSFIIGACTFALGFVPVFWLYLIFMGLIGVAMPFFNTPSTVLLQEKVEGDYLGRVFGVLGMIATSMMPLGMLVFGPISDIIKIEWLLMGTGFLLFIQGFFLLGSKVLIEAGKPEAVLHKLRNQGGRQHPDTGGH